MRVRTGPKRLTQKVPLSQRILELFVVVVLKVPRRGKHSLPPPSKVPFPPRQVSEESPHKDSLVPQCLTLHIDKTSID